jgi:hypothetical protein
VIFNGIPGDLTERSDLASRTIKLEIPRIIRRRTKVDLEREFEKIWPGVFGALLDGLVGGLRDGRGIVVDDPARLMDFEQFAEAGCRAMGFEEWDFVDAYKANRHGSMVVAAEASAVGRAVVAFLNETAKASEGRCRDCIRGSATTIIKAIQAGEIGPKARQGSVQNLVGCLSRWLLLGLLALPRWTVVRKAELRKMSCLNGPLRRRLR